jgi:SAM-dependent methyltransferase
MHKNKDVFGQAINDYYTQDQVNAKVIVHTDDFDDDEIPVDYLFRTYPEMPKLEQLALQKVRGKVLEIGCGAGSHALYLQEKKLDVTPIDISPLAIEIAQKRGLKKAECINFYDLGNKQDFDTLLLLMNGIGIAGKIERLHLFFEKAKQLLRPKGQIILDSSDLIYLFDEDEITGTDTYYGEMNYSISYKNYTSDPFDWLYIDYNSLEVLAEMNGFKSTLIKKGSHYDYLAQLELI